jgi:hypothetical protein
MFVLLSLVYGVTALKIDPQYAQNLTVFHLNPSHKGPVPVNMDSGDAMGDLYFDLLDVLLRPLACPNGTATPGGGCANPETTASDLVVNKLTLEVDNRFSKYAYCNLATAANINSSFFPHPPCNRTKIDEYCCICPNPGFTSFHQCSQQTVGRQDVWNKTAKYLRNGTDPLGCRPDDTTVACIMNAALSKLNSSGLHANWYSSLASGFCDRLSDGGDAATCTWRVVSVDKVITRECHLRIFGSAVQQTHPVCLEGCSSQQRTNASSACWAKCFFKAALGPDSAKPGGSVAGLSLAKLVSAWQKPFLPVEQGGCPDKATPMHQRP